MRICVLIAAAFFAAGCLSAQVFTFSDYFKSSSDYALRQLTYGLEGRADTLLGRSVDSIFADRPEAALDLVEEVILLDDRQPLAYLVRGYARVELDQLVLAIEDFDRALGLEPGLMEAYATKGRVQIMQEDHEGARATFERAAGEIPDSPVPPYLIGAMEYGDDHPIRARKLWEESVTRDSCYVPARLAILMQRIYAGRQMKGIRELEDLLLCDELSPDVYYLLAQTRAYKKDYDEALQFMANAIGLSPEDPDLLFYRSRLYRTVGRYDEALNDLNYAYAARSSIYGGDGVGDLEISNSRKEMEYALNYHRFRAVFAPEWREHASRYLLALHHRDSEELKKLERKLPRKAAGKSGWIYFNILSGIRTWGRDDDEILRLSEIALAGEPHIVDLYRIRGQIFLDRGEYRKAYEEFRRMSKYEARCIPGLKGMAAALTMMQKGAAAINLYSMVLDLDSTDIGALSMLGDLYYAQNDFARSLEYYDRTLEWRPRHGMIRHQMALCSYMLGQREETLEHIRNMPESYLNFNPAAINLRGLARLQLDSLDQAYADFNEAISRDTALTDAYLNRAKVNYLRGNLDLSRRELDYILERETGNPFVYALRYRVRKAQGEQDFCADLRRAQELGYVPNEEQTRDCNPPSPPGR